MVRRPALFLLFRLVVVVLVGMILLYLTRIAWQSARAFELNHRTHAAIEQWLQHRQQPTLKAWAIYKDRMLIAIAYQPGNATFINTLGRLYLYKGLSMQKHPVLRTLNVLKAKKLFLEASSLRPAWVYPWLNLAMANAAIEQWGSQFIHAYQMAMHQGRWEENTMPALIALGLRSYEHLDSEMQHRFTLFLSTAVQQREQHLDWLKTDQRLYQQACRILAGEHAGREFCVRVSAS